MSEPFTKYSALWPHGTEELQIEMACVRLGGQWKNKKTGVICGLGMSYHLERMRRIIWPELDGDHNGQRWHTLCRETICSHKITVLMGCGSSGKTHEAAWTYLCEWFCDPENTVVLVSSTDMRGLKLRVWGEITSLWERAVNRFDYLPGHLLDSALAITFEELEDQDSDERRVRDMRKAIIGIPTVQGGKQVGLAKWQGIKQKKVRLVADEAAAMSGSFLSAFSNLNNNEDFRAIILGNPSDTLDPLGKAAEPIDGWDAHMQPDKTCVWKTRFMNGACVNLIGTDSPNFDFPADEPTRFKYLISKEKIRDTESFFPKESFEWYSQCHGSMKIATLSTAVLTRRLCEQNKAFETDVIWLEPNRTKIWFTDAAYGGDRCVGGWAEFGKVLSGGTVILYHPPVIIPILGSVNEEPEHQIAVFMKKECEALGIQPENVGHDATGRGSLGTFLARVWSAATHPVESGGVPTDRPMSSDIYWNDPKTGQRRLKTCREGYSKRISEYWFSVRYAVQAMQVRGLEEDTVDEFRMRKWKRVSGDRMELESKSDMKERIGRSPDLADWCSGVLEMARRKGFMISKLENEEVSAVSSTWLRDLARKQQNLLRSKELVH